MGNQVSHPADNLLPEHSGFNILFQRFLDKFFHLFAGLSQLVLKLGS
jgi:hypothetical protein